MTSPLLQDLLGTALTVVALVLLVPAGVLLIQVLAAVLPERSDNARAALPALRPQVAVLVPAHDEAVGIGATLRSLLAQLAPGDRLLVVADNCSDDTAAIARSAGAEVIERVDAVRRGKGYALDFGIRHLEAAPPGVVVMVDADCALHPGSLERLVRLAVDSGRPVQALYLMAAPPGAALKTRIAEFAWVVKNQVRPLGFRRLGLPCQLMGSGMAFPWRIIRDAPLASAHIVEDMRLGLDLAAAGAAPLFCPDAVVTSFFPTHAEGIADQRARWERGHVGVILQEVPRAFRRALTRGRPSLAAMALDVSVPPLTILHAAAGRAGGAGCGARDAGRFCRAALDRARRIGDRRARDRHRLGGLRARGRVARRARWSTALRRRQAAAVCALLQARQKRMGACAQGRAR